VKIPVSDCLGVRFSPPAAANLAMVYMAMQVTL
jgi:hypothetical protein